MSKQWYELSSTIEISEDQSDEFLDAYHDLIEKYGNWIATRLSPIKEDEDVV